MTMQTKTPRYALFCLLLTGMLAGCARTPAAYWPAGEWRTSTPEEQGLDTASILGMLQEIQSTDLHVHSVLIVRHGYLVTEAYFPPYNRDLRHPVYSVAKSVTSAMTGIAIHDGFIPGVEEPVLNYFPDVARTTRDYYLPHVTLEHLLTMSAGFNMKALPDLSTQDSSFDAARYVLTYSSVVEKPGETFFYDTDLPHVLSAVIQQTSGLTLEEYARRKLFDPLGITDLNWEADPQGITMGATGLSLRPGDMARLGYLYLHNGQWNDQQIVPAAWVQDSTKLKMQTTGLMNAAEDDGYGYYWWIDSWDGYSAHGFGGQYIFVMPRQDMVVVFTSGLSNADFPVPHELVSKYLLPAARSANALPPNPRKYEQLAEEISKIQDAKGPTAPLPEIAGQISGSTYHLVGDGIAYWPSELRFDFPGGDTYDNTLLTYSGNRLVTTCSLNGVFYINRFGQDDQGLIACRGYWREGHTLVEEQYSDMLFGIDVGTVIYTFDEDEVSITVHSGMDAFPTLKADGEIIK